MLANLVLFQPVFDQEAPAPKQALQNFGIGEAQIPQLQRGEIVSYEVSETSQKELAIGIATIIPVPLPQIVDYTKRGSLSLTESDIIATGSLPADADINNFKKFGFAETYPSGGPI